MSCVIKVIVVDDHPLVREGIKSVFEALDDIEMTGWAGNGKEAEKLIVRVQPDVALVDMRLPGEHGTDIVERVRPLAPSCRFIILTSFAERDDIKRAMDAGVSGYILKEALPEEMIAALRLVARGRPYYDPTVMRIVMENQKDQKDNLSLLTERELEVLRSLSKGLNNKEIAAALYVTEHTVKKHISSILSKLALKDRTQAALYAVENLLGKSG